MGYRSFRDRQGTDWQAWDVVPALADRRVQERRTSRGAFEGERRRATERRVTIGRRPTLHAGLNGGWLCFEGAVEKRRLSPIPNDWLACTPEQLEQYLASAKPASRLTGPVTIPRLLRDG
jgi:hypothetical protein